MTQKLATDTIDRNQYIGGQPLIKLLCAATAIALTLTACGMPVIATERVNISAAQMKVIESRTAYRLKDPQSAQFRNVRRLRKTQEDGSRFTLVCGEVNGRNSFGGYTGFSTFTGLLDDLHFQVTGIGNNDTEWLYQAKCSE